MTAVEKMVALAGRRLFRTVLRSEDQFETTSAYCDYFGQDASDLISNGLLSSHPFAVSRFGHSELRAVLTYIQIYAPVSNFSKIMAYAKGQRVEPWWFETTVRQITHNAGVFPPRIDVIEEFCRLMLQEMKEIDVLGSWLGGERYIKPMLPGTKFMRFHDFYHFLHPVPWTNALAGKKVLVIHPFVRSIERQFAIKHRIFSGVHQLPDFELLTYKAVQSIAGNAPSNFVDWFEALECMKKEIAAIDFDIAILGCGAYGMPLAAFIKRDLARKAVHLGGNTQILFGIRGSRWENDPAFNHIFNEYWTKPLAEETPEGHRSIDNNCYW